MSRKIIFSFLVLIISTQFPVFAVEHCVENVSAITSACKKVSFTETTVTKHGKGVDHEVRMMRSSNVLIQQFI